MAYVTKSLSLAAYLYSTKGISFLGTGRSGNGNVYFQFKPKAKAEKLIADYYMGKAIGNIRDVFESYKTLKDLIFEIKNTHHEESLSDGKEED